MFEMWIRGHLVKISGYIDGPDTSVGIHGESFMVENIFMTQPGPVMVYGYHGDLEIEQTITESEWRDIGRAYWDSKPFDLYQYCVYSYQDTELWYT